MHGNQLKSPRHDSIRTLLRFGGPLLVLLGLVFLLIAMISFFWAWSGGGPPRFFWCGFVGLPLLFVGAVMCQFGYMGDVARYISAETSPVTRDTANYLGEGMQPGVKAVAKAITEGVLEANQESRND